jgi:hypothetical protein
VAANFRDCSRTVCDVAASLGAGAVLEALSRGLRLPQDLSIVGYETTSRSCTNCRCQ